MNFKGEYTPPSIRDLKNYLTKFLMKKNENWHRITNVNAELKIGDCSICGPGTDVRIRMRSNRNELSTSCRVIDRINARKRPSANPDASYYNAPTHEARLRRIARGIRVYGWDPNFTANDLEALEVKSNGLCSACFKPQQDGCALCVDHDHDTGKIRGLLCHPCNRIIGIANDATTTLLGCIEYLNQHQKL